MEELEELDLDLVGLDLVDLDLMDLDLLDLDLLGLEQPDLEQLGSAREGSEQEAPGPGEREVSRHQHPRWEDSGALISLAQQQVFGPRRGFLVFLMRLVDPRGLPRRTSERCKGGKERLSAALDCIGKIWIQQRGLENCLERSGLLTHQVTDIERMSANESPFVVSCHIAETTERNMITCNGDLAGNKRVAVLGSVLSIILKTLFLAQERDRGCICRQRRSVQEWWTRSRSGE